MSKNNSNLNIVSPSAEPHLNVLLYGPPKSGKTVGACSAPGPVLLVNADRPNASRYAHGLYGDALSEVHVDGLQTLIDVTLALDAGDFASVVVDPIGEVHRAVIEDLSGRAIRPKINEYGDTTVHVERFCRALCEKPLNTILVAHETAHPDEDTGGFERLPYTGTNNPALGSKLMAMVDVIGYTGTVEDDEGSVRHLAQLINARGRRGGDRTGALGASRDLDISEWVETARENAPKAQKESSR